MFVLLNESLDMYQVLVVLDCVRKSFERKELGGKFSCKINRRYYSQFRKYQNSEANLNSDQIKVSLVYRRLVSLVGKMPVYRTGSSSSIPGRTITQGLKIIAEKVLPLL